MGKPYHLEGQRFGRLLVLKKSKSVKNNTGTRVYWLCRCDCGKEKEIVTQNLTSKGAREGRLPHTQSCGCLRIEQCKAAVGEKHHLWKGGRLIRDGYVFVRTPTHLQGDGVGRSNGYIPEHRLVMIRHLRRRLLKTETVHHKNGVKTDNRLENLELWSKSHSDGERVEDKVEWAIQFLSMYSPQVLKTQHIRRALPLL